MDAGPEPIVAPNGVELTAHRLATATVRGESGAEYLVDADRPEGQPVDVLLERGTVWVTAQVGGSGVVVSSGAFRIDVVDGSVVIEAGYSGDGLVLVASGHVQLADASGTWQPLDAGQIAVLGPDGTVDAVDHVDDEELVEDRWVVANIGLDALDDQERAAAAAPADGGDVVAGPVPGVGHPMPEPVPAAPVDPAAVVATVLAGLGRPTDGGATGDHEGPAAEEPIAEEPAGPDEVEPNDGAAGSALVADAAAAPDGDDSSDDEVEPGAAASHDADEAPPWPPPEAPGPTEPWAIGEPLPEGEERAGHDLPYAPEVDEDDDGRRSRVRIIEIVLLVVVVIAAAAIIAAFNHKKHDDAGPPAIGSAASVVATSTTGAPRTSASTATTAEPTTTEAPSTTDAPSTTERATSTVPSTAPSTPTSDLTTSGSTAGPVAFHITHCSEVNSTKIVASGTVAGAVQNVSAYLITVAVVSPDGKTTLGQSQVRVPLATNGKTVPWQASIKLPAGSTPGGCKLVQFDFV